ncbi:MAG: hypothetical protein KF814_02485 [Nitrospiraceae bacterium]|nr:hypothetical protein [Nitrospiraceae bacterium]
MGLTATDFSGTRFSVTYQFTEAATEARTRAELLCIEQTVEATDEIIPQGPIRDHLLGRMTQFRSLRDHLHEAVLTFPVELLDESLESLWHVAYGIASLREGVRITDMSLPEAALSRWSGARFGVEGLRTLLNAPSRPLVCAVLKPLGMSPQQLGSLAYEFALGGVDIIKDDQGLSNHPFCPFEERVSRCADAVARAAKETGIRCLYAPHIGGSWPTLRARADHARRVGAGALLVCPGITGFDQMAELAKQTGAPLPILSHPAALGSYFAPQDSGIAPDVLFGLLPRLAGADVTIYPTFGLTYPISMADCQRIAATCRRPMGRILSILPSAAGRMGPARITEMSACYGQDVVYVLGSEIRTHRSGVAAACRDFSRQLLGT